MEVSISYVKAVAQVGDLDSSAEQGRVAERCWLFGRCFVSTSIESWSIALGIGTFYEEIALDSRFATEQPADAHRIRRDL